MRMHCWSLCGPRKTESFVLAESSLVGGGFGVQLLVILPERSPPNWPSAGHHLKVFGPELLVLPPWAQVFGHSASNNRDAIASRVAQSGSRSGDRLGAAGGDDRGTRLRPAASRAGVHISFALRLAMRVNRFHTTLDNDVAEQLVPELAPR
jgi:hypothetical protein